MSNNPNPSFDRWVSMRPRCKQLTDLSKLREIRQMVLERGFPTLFQYHHMSLLRIKAVSQTNKQTNQNQCIKPFL